MKTTKLDELLSKVFPHSWQREVVAGIKAEVAEDIRAACEQAWKEGAEYCAVQPFDYEEISLDNPYARKGTK